MRTPKERDASTESGTLRETRFARETSETGDTAKKRLNLHMLLPSKKVRKANVRVEGEEEMTEEEDASPPAPDSRQRSSGSREGERREDERKSVGCGIARKDAEEAIP